MGSGYFEVVCWMVGGGGSKYARPPNRFTDCSSSHLVVVGHAGTVFQKMLTQFNRQRQFRSYSLWRQNKVRHRKPLIHAKRHLVGEGIHSPDDPDHAASTCGGTSLMAGSSLRRAIPDSMDSETIEGENDTSASTSPH